MKSPHFEYLDPTTIQGAVAALGERGAEAKILAGGQSLVPLLNLRLVHFEVLVDLNRIAGLDYIREVDGALAIGALTRQRAMERSELVARRQPLLQAAARLIGHEAIRNRGTVVGSLVHADPAAELPAVAAALGAEVTTLGPRGERTISANDFFVTYLATAVEADEIVTEARFPVLPERTGWAIQEVARRSGDFALAGAVASVTLDGDGSCSAARIALFGVAPTPVRAHQAEQMLLGQPPADDLLARAGNTAASEIPDPISDVHASAEYRREVAGVLTRRALSEAVARARG